MLSLCDSASISIDTSPLPISRPPVSGILIKIEAKTFPEMFSRILVRANPFISAFIFHDI
jgi:hypothetical protein